MTDWRSTAPIAASRYPFKAERDCASSGSFSHLSRAPLRSRPSLLPRPRLWREALVGLDRRGEPLVSSTTTGRIPVRLFAAAKGGSRNRVVGIWPAQSAGGRIKLRASIRSRVDTWRDDGRLAGL